MLEITVGTSIHFAYHQKTRLSHKEILFSAICYLSSLLTFFDKYHQHAVENATLASAYDKTPSYRGREIKDRGELVLKDLPLLP